MGKVLFHPELLANERIRSQLNLALEMINQARDNLSYLTMSEKCQFEALQQQQVAVAYTQQQASTSMRSGIHVNNSMGEPYLNLKEVIEIYAQEHDIQFFPKVGCTYDGLQFYCFGTLSIYLDSLKQ